MAVEFAKNKSEDMRIASETLDLRLKQALDRVDIFLGDDVCFNGSVLPKMREYLSNVKGNDRLGVIRQA